MRALALFFCLLFGAASAAEPTGCPDFRVELPRPRPGAVLQAADYGFSVSNADNAAALQRAVDAARRQDAAAIELPAGRFPCFGPGGVELDGFRDFTLRGRETAFVFRRTPSNGKPNFRLANCERVLVEGVVSDWDWAREPLASFATVAAVHVDKADDASFVDFDLRDAHPGHPHPVPMLVANAMTSDFSGFRTGGGHFDCGTWFGHFGSRNEWLSPRRLRVWPAVRAPGQPQYGPQLALFSPARNRDFAGRFTVGEAVRLNHFYYGENAFELESNAHLTLRRVHVRACRSIGFLVKGAQHHWRMEDCSVAPEEGSGRAISATADACHVVRSRGFCQLVGCRWRLNEDDMNNFHDRATLVVKRGERGLEVVNTCGAGYLGAEPGDELELLHADYAPAGWRGRLVAVDGNVYAMDRPTPKETNFVFVAANRSYGTDNILISGCTFVSAGLRNLIHGSNVTVENCVWKGAAASPLRFQAAWTPDNWCEGSGCSNVVVRNCRFERDNLHRWKVSGRTAEIVTVALTPERTWCAPKKRTPAMERAIAARFPDGDIRVEPWAGAISDVLVEGCTFVDPIQYTWQMETGRNLTFRRNRTVITRRSPDDPPDRGKVFCGPQTENVRLE